MPRISKQTILHIPTTIDPNTIYVEAAIREMFGVSTRAIREWRNELGLPSVKAPKTRIRAYLGRDLIAWITRDDVADAADAIDETTDETDAEGDTDV